jgi:hypothetical protein
MDKEESLEPTPEFEMEANNATKETVKEYKNPVESRQRRRIQTSQRNHQSKMLEQRCQKAVTTSLKDLQKKKADRHLQHRRWQVDMRMKAVKTQEK